MLAFNSRQFLPSVNFVSEANGLIYHFRILKYYVKLKAIKTGTPLKEDWHG